MSTPPPPPPPGGPFPQQPNNPFPQQPMGYQAGKQGNSGLAIASLVCSLVGLVPCFWFFQIMGLLGTIFGAIGLKQTKNNERGGRGLAMAGFIIGIILVVGCIAFWIYAATHSNCVRSGNRFVCS
jgi:Domain of unknown function (DUF4190)